jgi:predicted RNA-binding protein with RPS1 domain
MDYCHLSNITKLKKIIQIAHKLHKASLDIKNCIQVTQYVHERNSHKNCQDHHGFEMSNSHITKQHNNSVILLNFICHLWRVI